MHHCSVVGAAISININVWSGRRADTVHCSHLYDDLGTEIGLRCGRAADVHRLIRHSDMHCGAVSIAEHGDSRYPCVVSRRSNV